MNSGIHYVCSTGSNTYSLLPFIFLETLCPFILKKEKEIMCVENVHHLLLAGRYQEEAKRTGQNKISQQRK
jgi:hypothetical protein